MRDTLVGVVTIIVLLAAFVGPAQAGTWKQIWLDDGVDLVDFKGTSDLAGTAGALTYVPGGGNAAASGKFYDYLAHEADGTGNDWVDLFPTSGISGNFAMFGVFTYQTTGDNGAGESASPDFWTWLQANPDQRLELWIEFDNLKFDDPNWNGPLQQLTIDGGIFASYNSLSVPGWTDMGNGIQMDFIVSPTSQTLALGVVGTHDFGNTGFDLAILNKGVTFNSRLRYQAVPIPSTIALLSIGLACLGFMARRKRARGVQ